MKNLINKVKLFWEELPQRVAYLLPRDVAYWAFVRVAVHASRANPDTEVPALTPADCLKAWKEKP